MYRNLAITFTAAMTLVSLAMPAAASAWNSDDVISGADASFNLLGSGFYASAIGTGVFFNANTLRVLNTNVAQDLFGLASTDGEQAPLGKPTVKMLPSYSGMEYGFNYISRFTVTAPSDYPVSLKSIAFRVGTNLPAGFKVDTFALVSTDYETYDQALGYGWRVTDASCGFVVSASQMCVRVWFAEEFVIPEGASHEFLLSAFVRSPLGKTGLMPGHSVVSVVLGDSQPMSGALADSSVGVTIGSIPQNFIWSDLSHDDHSAASFDWWNGTYAIGLPTVPFAIIR